MPAISHLAAVAATAVLALSLGAGDARAQTIASRLTTDRCMDVPGGSGNRGAQVALWSCHGGENQRFTVLPGGQIRTASGLCLNALGGAGRDGDRVGVWPCGGGANELWQVHANGSITGINGKCIDVPNGNSAPGTGLVLWTCNGGNNQKWTVAGTAAAAASGAPVRKLYVLDGTDSREVHHNAMYHLYEQWQGPKHWQNGPNLMATNIDGLYDQAYATVCQDVRPASQGGAGVTEVFIAGYSRGAFMAVKLANEARARCGANVRFLGLVDAVNSNIYNWPTTVNPGIPVAVHIRKMAGWEHVLTTRDIGGATRILNPEDVDHQTIVCSLRGNDSAWKWTRDRLVEYARQAGGTLSGPRRAGTDCVLAG